MSEETRAKLREAHKHHPPGWYEKVCQAARNRSPEWRKKLSEIAKHRKPTPRQLAALAIGRSSGVWRHSQVGENNGNVILTWDKVAQIREMYATGGFSQEKLGSLFGVKQVTISAIVRHRIWRLNTLQG